MLRHFVVLACCCFTLIVCQCDRIGDVLNGLEKVLDYVHANKRLMNVDAVFGLVLGQAQIVHITTYNQVPKQYVERSLAIQTKLVAALEETKEFLDPNPRNYLFMYTVLAVEAWMRNITFLPDLVGVGDVPELRKVKTYDEYIKLLTGSKFEEQSSDDCMIELLQQQKYCCMRHTCIVSHECYKIMRLGDKQGIDPGYGVTHSLLFLQVARSQKCKLNENLLKRKIRRFCSYILWELRKSAQFGFLGSLDDLFLEQVTLCGYEGFAEFFSADIIEHIIRMQHPSGCFTVAAEAEDRRSSSVRRKRESNMISENCIDHTTGLGVSTLALTLRYLMQRSPNGTHCDHARY